MGYLRRVRLHAFLWLTVLFIFSLPFTVYASGDGGIWTGWLSFESGSEGGRQAGGDNGHAYGIGQFDDRYSLMDFLGFCLETDGAGYAVFSDIYTKYVSSSQVVSDSAADTASLVSAWHNTYDDDPEGFTGLQLEMLKSSYYSSCVSACAAAGIDLEDNETYSPVLRGTLWSISVWNGNAKAVIATFSPEMTELELLDLCYSDLTASLKDSTASAAQKAAFKSRWTGTQKTMAVQAYTQWLNGITIPTTDSDLCEILAGVTTRYGIDGGSYVDYVREWISLYPDLAETFIELGGWNSEVQEWCLSIRNAGDFYELYGIIGNGLTLDLSSSTSGGLLIGDVDICAPNYEIPDNGGSMPVVYYSQGGGQPWSGLAFGQGNIASSGCSITSLAMVISYLSAGTDSDGWVYPSDVRAMIAEKNGGDYNAFDSGGSGARHEIMAAVAGYYGLDCEVIGKASITAALAGGHPVIVSCVPGEFTSSGHFIVLTGLTEDGYIVVNDPAHPSKSGNKYTQDYIISQTKGWWAFST